MVFLKQKFMTLYKTDTRLRNIMAFQLGDDHVQIKNEMNLIPLIDVMLVLMIIFFIDSDCFEPNSTA